MAAHGFSLIEALLTLLVIGFGYLGIARLQAGLWRNQGAVVQQSHAAYSAYEKMEELRGLDKPDSGNRTESGNGGNIELAWQSVLLPSARLRHHYVKTEWISADSIEGMDFVGASVTPGAVTGESWLGRIDILETAGNP